MLQQWTRLLVGCAILVSAVATAGIVRTADAGPTELAILVNTNSDAETNVCDETHCSLREAILLANQSFGSHDTITFDPAVFPPDDETDIVLYASLPAIDARYGITIDGTGAGVVIAGYEVNEVDPTALLFRSTIGSTVSNIVVRNLGIYYWSHAIWLCPAEVMTANGRLCTYNGSEIEIANVSIRAMSSEAIRFFGVDYSDVTVSDVSVDGSEGPDLTAIRFFAEGDVTDVEVTGSAINDVENTAINIQAFRSLADVTVANNEVTGTVNYGIAVTALASATAVSVSGNTVSDTSGSGLFLSASGSLADAAITDNTVTGAGSQGIAANFGGGDGVLFQGNSVSGSASLGLDISFESSSGVVIEDNTLTGSGTHGLHIYSSGGRTLIRRNNIHDNIGDGIEIERGQATISENKTTSNGGLGIDLFAPDDPANGVTVNDAGDTDSNFDNPLLNYPVIQAASAVAVTGTACANCTAELFVADDDPSGYGEGAEFIASAVANGAGQFSVATCGLGIPAGTKVTATATSPAGDTSEFSLNFTLPVPSGECPTPSPTPSPTPTPTASPTVTQTPAPTLTATPIATPSPTSTASGADAAWGDSDCSGAIGARDNQALLRHVLSQSPLSQTEPCPDLGETVDGRIWGDWDCSGAIGARDNQALLRHVLSQPPLSQTEPCPDIGTQA